MVNELTSDKNIESEEVHSSQPFKVYEGVLDTLKTDNVTIDRFKEKASINSSPRKATNITDHLQRSLDDSLE